MLKSSNSNRPALLTAVSQSYCSYYRTTYDSTAVLVPVGSGSVTIYRTIDRSSYRRSTSTLPIISGGVASCAGGEMLRNQIMYFTLVFTEKTPIQKNRKE